MFEQNNSLEKTLERVCTKEICLQWRNINRFTISAISELKAPNRTLSPGSFLFTSHQRLRHTINLDPLVKLHNILNNDTAELLFNPIPHTEVKLTQYELKRCPRVIT